MVSFSGKPNRATLAFLNWWHGERMVEIYEQAEKNKDKYKDITSDKSLSPHEKLQLIEERMRKEIREQIKNLSGDMPKKI